MTDDAIQARIDRLRDRYGGFPVETAEYDLDDRAYERARDLDERGIDGAARVWVERCDPTETLLVREQSRPDAWGVPGGLIDPGEDADDAGEREVREETDVECSVVDVAYVHRAVRTHEAGGKPAIEEVAVAFVAEYVGGAPDPQPSEIAEVQWWETLPGNAVSPATRIAEDRL